MEDVKKSGYLRKQKSMRRRFFVLRGGGSRAPARLEYYENEKKFRLVEGSGGPRGTLNLEETIGVNKRADAKRKHLLVLYTRDGGLTVSAEGEEEQEEWYGAIMELLAQARCLSSSPESTVWPGPAFREVWQVSVRPRGLGQSRNLSGIYRLCLTERTLSLVRLRADAPSVTLQLMNVRRCGHSDNFFFVEVGRSAVTGPGELWMQVEDSVVAQNMHETILEAMKSLSEEFRPRTKSQSLSSTPITVPSRRHLPNPPPPSQVGFSRRSRAEANPESSLTTKSHSSPRDHSPPSPEEEEEKRSRMESAQPLVDNASASSDEYGSSPSMLETPAFLPPSPVSGGTNYISMAQDGRKSLVVDTSTSNIGTAEEEGNRVAHFDDEDNYAMMGRSDRREAGYMPMLPGTRCQDYMPMTPNSISPPAPLELAGYVMMSPLGSCSPETERTSWPPSGEISVGSADSHSSDYMNMWPLSRSASSTPPPQESAPSSFGKPSRIPASYRSLPRSYKMDPSHLAHTSGSSSSDSLEEASAGRNRRPLSVSVDSWRTTTMMGNYCRPPSPGEYVSIHFRTHQERTTSKDIDIPPQEYIAMEMQHPQASNGDYTEMVLGLNNVQPQTKPTCGPTTEKALRPITENLFVSMPATETKMRPAMEKSVKPSTNKDFWPAMTTDKTFRQKIPKEMLYPNAKLAPEVSPDGAFGLLEKALAARPAIEDGEMRPLVTAVAGCGLLKGMDRVKAVRSDPPARARHCSDTLASASSCNGNRLPAESGLNYIDLDLAKDGGTIPTAALVGTTMTQATKSCPLGATPCSNMYASIDFQMSGELRRNSKDGTEC
ncbi:insulin receptor substrate 1-like [Spea bombifrons]|uniref:insulin receptor substrate 1-like n=1 Tax=Spea bombifrons TaxID=233779 RepID=UPI002349FA8D|nr:insulin receptor substrate 1-like [Spea bombifrons]